MGKLSLNFGRKLMDMQKKPKLEKTNFLKRFPFGWLLLFFLLVILMNSFSNIPATGIPKEISYSQFYQTLKNNPEQIKKVTKTDNLLQGETTDNSKFFVNFPENDPEMLSLMRQNLKSFEIKPARTFWI